MTKPVQARDASKPFLAAQDDASRLETDPEHPADCEQVRYVLKRDPRGSIGLPGPLPPLPGGGWEDLLHAMLASAILVNTQGSGTSVWARYSVPYCPIYKAQQIRGRI